MQDLDKEFDCGGFSEWMFACECLKPKNAKGIEICCRGQVGFFFELFWGEISGGTDDGSRRSEARFVGKLRGIGDAEVEQIKMRKRLFRGEEDVCGFEVAVQDALAVDGRKGGAELFRDGEQPTERNGGMAFEDGLKVFAFEVFEGHKRPVGGVGIKVEQWDDMGMMEAFEDLCFAFKAAGAREVISVLGQQEFERRASRRGFVFGFVDNGHSALFDFSDDMPIADLAFERGTVGV